MLKSSAYGVGLRIAIFADKKISLVPLHRSNSKLFIFRSYSFLFRGSCWRMHYVLKDVEEANIMTIVGPKCIGDGPLSCCCENKSTVSIEL